jgi:hypothetical protein
MGIAIAPTKTNSETKLKQGRVLKPGLVSTLKVEYESGPGHPQSNPE